MLTQENDVDVHALARQGWTVLIGVRLQLAGQMSLYASREDVGLQSFAEQALEDLGDAAARLPGYFRPHATQAAVYERLGWAARKAAAPDSARRAFRDAVRK